MNELWSGVITIATAIVGLAIVAVIVSNNAQTGSVIGAATGGFAQDIGAAVSPLSGGGSFGNSFTGGGVSSYPSLHY